jgi:hypothetical protein
MIYHVFSDYIPRHPDTKRRMLVARRTWARQPWTEIPVPDLNVRLYQDKMGKVPHVKDLIETGVSGKSNDDIIVFTNSDICVSSDCSFKIVMALQAIDAGYCFRRDFRRLEHPIPDSMIHTGYQYCGSDLYAFRVGWWRAYGHEFPDMLLGREAWDSVLRLIIEETHPKQNPTLHNLIYHERHGSVWENPANRRTIPSQLFNINLARSFCYAIGFDPRRIGV